MDTRSPSRSFRRPEHGATSLQVVILLVPVFFGLMGFAVDLGRLYMARYELKVAANAMALAAAQKLIGTEAAIPAANSAAQLAIEGTTGYGNKYDYAGLPIGGTTGTLTSEAPDPAYYETTADAIGGEGSTGNPAAGSSRAKHVRADLNAEVPLVFWSFLPVAQERKVQVHARAAAGVSAPLCTACGIEALAVEPVDAGETTNFGFIPNARYTFYYQCTGAIPPGVQISGTTDQPPIAYLILNRYDQAAQIFADESSQLYRIGAQGLPPSADASRGCVSVIVNPDQPEQVWVSAAPAACTPPRASSAVSAMLCGVTTRFDATIPDACSTIPEIGSMAAIYPPDTDIADLDDYTVYTGNTRRVITVPVVEDITATANLVVLGFRQFLIEPNPGATNIDPSDARGRFVALYLGSVAPVKQGSFAGCTQTTGPGKVVLYQ